MGITSRSIRRVVETLHIRLPRKAGRRSASHPEPEPISTSNIDSVLPLESPATIKQPQLLDDLVRLIAEMAQADGDPATFAAIRLTSRALCHQVTPRMHQRITLKRRAAECLFGQVEELTPAEVEEKVNVKDHDAPEKADLLDLSSSRTDPIHLCPHPHRYRHRCGWPQQAHQDEFSTEQIEEKRPTLILDSPIPLTRSRLDNVAWHLEDN